MLNLKPEFSKYRYIIDTGPDGRDRFSVYRHDENITSKVMNNVLLDLMMAYEQLNDKLTADKNTTPVVSTECGKLTLDEAIQHCLDVAEQNDKDLKDAIALGVIAPEEVNSCESCIADHKQLAEWLKDYKYLKKQVSKLIYLGAAFNIIRECDGQIVKIKAIMDQAVKEVNELLGKEE